MKFFATGELDHTVSSKVMDTQNKISESIVSMLSDKTYGNGIIDWFYISIVMPTEDYDAGFFKERTLYKRKDKATDFRLKIGYEDVLNANEQETFRLICKSILRSIDVAEAKKIKDFDFNSFRRDLTDLFQREGWI